MVWKVVVVQVGQGMNSWRPSQNAWSVCFGPPRNNTSDDTSGVRATKTGTKSNVKFWTCLSASRPLATVKSLLSSYYTKKHGPMVTWGPLWRALVVICGFGGSPFWKHPGDGPPEVLPKRGVDSAHHRQTILVPRRETRQYSDGSPWTGRQSQSHFFSNGFKTSISNGFFKTSTQ